MEIAGGVRHPVYRGLLAQHSEYFKTALKGPWKEAEEGEVHLEDVQCAPCAYLSAHRERSSWV